MFASPEVIDIGGSKVAASLLLEIVCYAVPDQRSGAGGDYRNAVPPVPAVTIAVR
jgi:hypothetical protein